MVIFLPEYGTKIAPIGSMFLNLIKMVVIPLIFFSILNGISSMDNASTFTRLGGKALSYYLFTSAFAVVLGLASANFFHPGVGTGFDPIMIGDKKSNYDVMDFIMGMIPTNPINAMATGNTIQVVVFALFTGGCLVTIDSHKSKHVRELITSCTHLVFKMIFAIIQLSPYGVFAMMAGMISQYGLSVLSSLSTFIFVFLGALLVQYILFGVMIVIFGRMNPVPFFKKMLPIQSLAFATSSSKAVLPTAMKIMRDNMGVSKPAASFILPLGAAMNMDAISIYLGFCCVFFAQISGIEFTMAEYGIIIFTSTIGSIGGAGFPGGSIVMMGVVLSSVNIPLEYMSLILGIDRILEMFRTLINLTGDCTITLIVDNQEGTLNKKIYYSDQGDDDME